MKITGLYKFLGFSAVLLTACAAPPLPEDPAPSTTQEPSTAAETPHWEVGQPARTITINGDSLRIDGDVTTWGCRDYVNLGRILVEVGTFTRPALSDYGFVLYDGGDTGVGTQYSRAGLDHRWDWGGANMNDYAFVLEPDGTGVYYDFGSRQSGKPQQIYACRRK